MNTSIRMGQTLSLLTAVLTAMAVCWVTGCAKKSEREAIPETRDTLSVISDTLSKTYDTLFETPDTLSKISGTLTDKRDGKTYKTVSIGKQTWMAENLNYATSRGSWCYGNKPDSCNKYGRLYDWAAAMNIDSSFNNSRRGDSDEQYQGVCPSEWHLPSNAEWTALVNYVESEQGTGSGTAAMYLKSTSGWYNSGNGSDYYGFSALPGAYRHYSDGSFYNAGYLGYWWTATEYDAGNAYGRYMYCNYDRVSNDNDIKEYGFSVRCVRDRSATGASPQKSVGESDMVGIEMVFVKGGTFMMGCTNEQGSDCNDNEKPAHSVTVSDFYIGKYEVTQNQWVQVMGGNNPSYFKGGNLPVEQVGWNDVQRFILRLNSMTGKKYRLPTEAEWEYAARGGASSKGYKYSGSNDVNYAAWYNVNSGDNVLSDDIFVEYVVKKNDLAGYNKILVSNRNRTWAVGTKAPNELGIYDMSGNVFEWVSDLYGDYSSAAQTNPRGPTSSLYRMFRGGGWTDDARYCRVSYRSSDLLGSGNKSLGFRLVLSP